MKHIIRTGSFLALSLLISACTHTKNDHKKSAKHTGSPRMNSTKTASGLSSEVLKAGTGESPKRGQLVTVHYTGWLDNNGQPGTKFDSSVDRGEPFTFVIGVGQVIPGWDEGVALMKVGEKRRLIIPSTLGYGARGAGRAIPPHATLIFDVELLKVS